MLQENDNGFLASYSYDDLYRLVAATDKAGNCSWAYDLAGNRTSQTVNSVTTSFTVNAANRLAAVGGVPVTMNANGNLVSFNGESYTWDVRNELKSMTKPGYSGAWGYDLNGLRATQTVNGVTTNFVLDGARCVKETSGANVTNVPFGPGGALSRGTRWFTPDNQGTGTLTDSAGAKVQGYSYGPFGKGTSLSVSYFLTSGASGGMDLITPGHRRYTFSWQYDWHTGTYAYEDNRDPEMLGAVYTQTGTGLYDGTLRFKNGDKLIFVGGALTRMQDLPGNFVDVDSTGGRHVAIRLGGSSYPRVDFTYDGNGHVTAMTYWYTGSPGSRQWTFAYDANQRLSTITNPLGGVTRYTWTTYTRALDGQVLPLIATITNPRNNVPFTAQYDTSGRITQVTAADAGVTTFAYTAAPGSDGTTTLTDPRSNVTSWSYTWPPPVYGTAKYGYRLTSMTDPLGRTTTYEALHAGSQLITKITDFRSRVTTLDWDFYLGNQTSVTTPTVSGGTVTTTSVYEPGCSLCTSVTDPLGRQATATVSGGNVTQTKTPRTYPTNYGYDGPTGDLTSIIPPVGRSRYLTHDYFGDVTQVTDGFVTLGSATYDSAQRCLSTTDANNKTVQYVYDALDRVTAVQQTLSGQTLTTSFEYDADGNRTALVDAKNQRWEWTYDASDRMIQDKNPLLQTRAYTRDKNGNILTYTDRLNQTWVFTYGAGDRIATQTFKKADSTVEATVTYTYDSVSKLLASVNDTLYGTVSYVYDTLDRLTSVTRPSSSGNQTITYTLDNLGRRTGLQVPGQGAITYTFDNNDNIASTSQNSQTTSFAYDELDRMTQRSLPNTVSTAWTYNSMGFLNVMSSTKGGVEFDHRLYERANDGTLARETSNGVVTNYFYDDLYHLTSAAITGGTTSSWTYDNVGNRLSQTVGGVTTNYTHNSANRLLTVNGATVTSDANGSVTAYGSDTYSWDVRNRLKSEVHGGTTYQFVYDADDLRTKKTVGSTVTEFLLEGGSVVKETTGGASKHTLQSPVLDQPLSRDGKWFVPDHLGSSVAITDGAGVIAQAYGYSSFGELTNSPTDPNPFQFTGRENDGTGLMYYRARYYVPQWGRFLSEDPIGFEGGINQYAYCGNNPVNGNDGSGLTYVKTYDGPISPWVQALFNRKNWNDFVHDPFGSVRDWGTYLLEGILPPKLIGKNIKIEIPHTQKQDAIDEFFQGRPTRPITDRKTGEVVGKITTDSGPNRWFIDEHDDPGTPQTHINLHDGATGANIHVILK